MKGSQKRWQPNNTDGVMATLMGFDELQSKPPSHEKQRVLSESYYRKVASIALRPGSLVSVGRAHSRNNEIVHGVKGGSEVRRSKGKSENVLDKCMNLSTSNVRTRVSRSKPAGASISKSLSDHRYGNRKTLGNIDEHCATRHVLRYHQKLDHDLLAGHLGESVTDFICHSEEVSEPGYKKYSIDQRLLHDRSPLVTKSRKQSFVSWNKKNEVQEFGVYESSRTLNETISFSDKKSMPKVSDMRLGRIGSCNLSSLHYTSSESSSPSVSSSMDIWNDECLKSLSDFEFEEIKEILSTGWKLMQDKSTAKVNKSIEQTTSQDILESKGGRGTEQFQTSLGVDDIMSPGYEVSGISRFCASCFGSSYSNPEAYIQYFRDEIDNHFENNRSAEIEPSKGSSKLSNNNLSDRYINDASYANAETFNAETSLNEFSEDDSAYPNCSGIGPPVSMENLKRTYQHSPDSVLEPYDTSTPFGCFDSIGLQLQLQALKYESEGTHSEESEIIVSGDEDFGEQLGKVCHDGRKVKRWLRDDKSKNFSYMVDVLDEAGIFDMNSFMDFNSWASLECPISPSVFAALEEKYGKQTSWQKSDRLLLFDRINLGILNIFNPFINFHVGTTSIRRKLCASFRRDEVEDELWNMLISQENANSKEFPGKALDEWFEVQEGIGIICRELETSIFDELVVELASMWS